MNPISTPLSITLLKSAVTVLILKVTAAVVINYRNYFPPNFDSDFLHGRESYFSGSYQWAFWLHLFAGPLSLITGLLLVSSRFRLMFPRWHRRLGRIQAVNVLVLLVPSGFWMSFYAASGPIVGVSLGTLSIVTGLTMIMAWRTALQRRFLQHRHWALRNFTLLCSAVALRLIGGTATVFEYGPYRFDPVAAWTCWVVPLSILECALCAERRVRSQSQTAFEH